MDPRRLRPDERRRSLLRGRCPACGHASDEIVRDYWAEDTLDDGWRVALRLVVRDGQVAVGEVRVIPRRARPSTARRVVRRGPRLPRPGSRRRHHDPPRP
ncbi:MAG: hypothetical protein M5U31_16340 [Acidimicrobiia bacterium]|nr:hypothetical protein [Acidimicrobiia bacterium]